ncbi:MAG: M28 family peptidase [Oscillospiraceae bacterium]|nr:M28 family peptidase [Oscillospiraceae bacterium]
MTQNMMSRIFADTDFVHQSGTPEELRVAEYLKAQCEALGLEARLEAFPVAMSEMEEAHVYADGREIPCKGFFCCGSGEVEAELYHMPAQDPVSIAGAKDKIVLIDASGIGFFGYQDLMKAGAKGILFQYGDTHYPVHDIDERDLRAAVVGEAEKVLCVMLHTADAVELLRQETKRVKISIRQREYEGASHNVIAELPGQRDEWIVLTAHYDSTALSHGSYDNMSGCVGVLGVLDALKEQPLNYGLRLVFCGSEERGLLGSKAYTRDHEAELSQIALNINLDMIGSWLGKFIARVSAEDKLVHYLSYMGAELGFPVEAKQGVYSSDSTPFADKGVPALSFARFAAPTAAPIHCRYDLPEVLSMAQLEKDIAFIAEFTRRMAMSAVCPIGREIPEKVKTELDEYLFRKRRP